MSDTEPPPWERGPDKFPCGHARSVYAKCATCEGKRNREQVERLAEVIADAKRLLAAGTDPETERVLIHRLNALGHPDASGLVAHLNSKRSEEHDNPRGRR